MCLLINWTTQLIYNNTYQRTLNIKPVDVKSSTYIDFDFENKDRKLKVGNHVRIKKKKKRIKYKNIFGKCYIPNWSEEAFIIEKVKNTVPWTYVIEEPNGEEIVGTFYEKELQKKVKQSLELKR